MFSTLECLRIAFSLFAGVFLPICCHAWVGYSTLPTFSMSGTDTHSNRQQPNFMLSAATTSDALTSTSEEDDDEEYEFVEYDILTEPEFMGSEWLVGTVMDRNPNKIQETWVRLATDKDGKNVAIWGDNSQGTWSFDVANQFLSISKEQLWGKDIWAGVVDDYYYTQGTVRGWNFFAAAAVRGQWQAKRLGVDPNEAGVAPWFQEDDDDEKATSSSPSAASEDSSS
jgi:hypothetical protein